jgi:hypothetical protein
MKTKLMALLLVTGGAMLAETHFSVGVRLGYGRPAVGVVVVNDHRPPCPGPEYVWAEGYYDDYDAWIDGYWAMPPYAGAYWVGPHRADGRFFAGYWGGPRYERRYEPRYEPMPRHEMFDRGRGWDRDRDRDRGWDRGRDRDRDRGRSMERGFRPEGRR